MACSMVNQASILTFQTGMLSCDKQGLQFGGASSFNQNLCPWGPKLPSNFAYGTYAAGMFDSSGCTNKNRPTGPTGPWCAVTNWTASPTASSSVSPTTSTPRLSAFTPTTWDCHLDLRINQCCHPDFSAFGATHSIDVVSPLSSTSRRHYYQFACQDQLDTYFNGD